MELFWIFFLMFYFLPGIVASNREHHNKLAIWMVNVFLGATGIGWIAAMVWACTAVKKTAT